MAVGVDALLAYSQKQYPYEKVGLMFSSGIRSGVKGTMSFNFKLEGVQMLA